MSTLNNTTAVLRKGLLKSFSSLNSKKPDYKRIGVQAKTSNAILNTFKIEIASKKLNKAKKTK